MAESRRGRSGRAALDSVDPSQTLKDYEAAMRGLGAFTAQFWDVFHGDYPFVGGYAFDAIAEHYEEWMDPEGSIQNLIINQPFRTGKSTQLVYAMAYRWLFAPWSCWMFATYDHGLTMTDSIRCRKLITHPRYQAVLRACGMTITLNSDENTQKRFVNNHNGFRMAFTIGGGLGYGAHYLAVDDPIDPKQARLRSKRDACIDWWRSTWRHRVKGDVRKVRRLVVQQRVNQADLTGYLLDNEAGEWEHLVLPMRYEPKRLVFAPTLEEVKKEVATAGEEAIAALAKQLTGGKEKVSDPIRFTSLQNRVARLRDNAEGSGRVKAGDLLWPERFPEKQVKEFERTLGKDAPGQLQQRPSSAAGNIFRVDKAGIAVGKFDDVGRLHVVELLAADGKITPVAADRIRWFQVMDTATKTSAENSFTVVGTFGLTDDSRLLVWHLFRERLEVPDQYPAIKLLRAGPAVWDEEARQAQGLGVWPGPLVVRYIEPKSSGIGLIQTSIIDGAPLTALTGVPGDKVERSGHAAGLYESGSVYHRPGPWLSQAVEELRLFPNADFDDIADVVAYAGHVAATNQLLRAHINRRMVLNQKTDRGRAVQEEVLPAVELDRLGN